MPKSDPNVRYNCAKCGATINVTLSEHYKQVHQDRCTIVFKGESRKIPMRRGADGLWRCPRCAEVWDGSCRKIQDHARLGRCKAARKKKHARLTSEDAGETFDSELGTVRYTPSGEGVSPTDISARNTGGTKSENNPDTMEQGGEDDDAALDELGYPLVDIAGIAESDLADLWKWAESRPPRKPRRNYSMSSFTEDSTVVAPADLIALQLPATERSPSPPSHPPADIDILPQENELLSKPSLPPRKAIAKKPRFGCKSPSVTDVALARTTSLSQPSSPTRVALSPSSDTVPGSEPSDAVIPAALTAFFGTVNVPLRNLTPIFIDHGFYTESTLDLLCTTPVEGNWEVMKADILAQGRLAGWLAVKRALEQRAELLQGQPSR